VSRWCLLSKQSSHLLKGEIRIDLDTVNWLSRLPHAMHIVRAIWLRSLLLLSAAIACEFYGITTLFEEARFKLPITTAIAYSWRIAIFGRISV